MIKKIESSVMPVSLNSYSKKPNNLELAPVKAPPSFTGMPKASSIKKGFSTLLKNAKGVALGVKDSVVKLAKNIGNAFKNIKSNVFKAK